MYSNSASVAWTADGKSLFLTSIIGDRANVYMQPVDGGAQRKVTNFNDQLAGLVAPAPDGKSLLLSRFDIVRDAVLVTGFE